MNQFTIRKADRIAGNAMAMTTLISLVTLTESAAQSHLYAHHFTKPATTEIYKSKVLQVAVYHVGNTGKFKVHFENNATTPVTLRIKNAANKVVHEEVVTDKKYVRKFDMEKMEDGAYVFEVSNKQENYTNEIRLQTLSARTIQVNK